MKQIIVAGTGYVGLATGVSFATIGFKVTCVDIDENKINLLQKGICPIYEPGLQEALLENIMQERIDFTTNIDQAYSRADVIFIAVGTPELPDGTADLKFLKEVAKDIAIRASKDLVVVIKSTVPVGTNEVVKQILKDFAHPQLKIDVVSNPEFLREGSALHDIFHGDRIVIGADYPQSASYVEELYKSFNLPTFVTSVRSAEMIKYASNAFLATKISFINEIASICEAVGADVEQVARGMGLDRRIGSQFLNAGIGFGGSCFPKDTSALIQS
ncbi:UDP-glucose/GDP-mannose dehydrogenase family protein, partial [Bacillus velezensis]|uniref:UDP-glucose dehydrogenase family protein n=1 Tax=Bacillus velezensis TaxID=492670 RepID=UPI002FFEB4FE